MTGRFPSGLSGPHNTPGRLIMNNAFSGPDLTFDDIIASLKAAGEDTLGYEVTDEVGVMARLAQHSEARRRRELLNIVDVGDLMLNGDEQIEMLVSGLPFVDGVHTEVFGPKQNGK